MPPAPRKTLAIKKASGPPAKKVATTSDKKVAATAPSLSRAKIRAQGMRPLDPTKDSDLSLAMREMLIGGASRQEVLHRLREGLAQSVTRSGRSKPASTIMNHALNRAEAHGYKVESSWRLVPIPGYVEPERVEEPAPAPAPAQRAVKKAVPAKKATPRAIKKVAASKPAASTNPAPAKKKLVVKKG